MAVGQPPVSGKRAQRVVRIEQRRPRQHVPRVVLRQAAEDRTPALVDIVIKLLSGKPIA